MYLRVGYGSVRLLTGIRVGSAMKDTGTGIIIIIKDIYIAQVRKGHKCAMSTYITNCQDS